MFPSPVGLSFAVNCCHLIDALAVSDGLSCSDLSLYDLSFLGALHAVSVRFAVANC
jgi:hypothetical protein